MTRKMIVAAILAATGISAAQAGTIVLPMQRIGNTTLPTPTLQTNWATNAQLADAVHAPSTGVNFVSPMAFTKFDTLGGTRILTNVSIALTGSFVGTMTLSNQSDSVTDTQYSSASLTVTELVDIFNNYTQFNFSQIELSGFPVDAGGGGYNPSMAMSSVFNAVALPVTLAPGQSVTDISMGGSWTSSLNYSTGLAAFIGDTGTWDVGCLARSVDDSVSSGGSPLRGHEAFADCTAEVTYTYREVPVPAPLALMSLGLIALARSRRTAK